MAFGGPTSQEHQFLKTAKEYSIPRLLQEQTVSPPSGLGSGEISLQRDSAGVKSWLTLKSRQAKRGHFYGPTLDTLHYGRIFLVLTCRLVTAEPSCLLSSDFSSPYTSFAFSLPPSTNTT